MELHDLNKVPATVNEALNGFVAPSRTGHDTASYLQEFAARWDQWLHAMETHVKADLKSRGADEHLMRDYEVIVLEALREFSPQIAAAIRDAQEDTL